MSGASVPTRSSSPNGAAASAGQSGSQAEDVHSLASKLDTDSRPVVIRAYFEAYALLEKVGVEPKLPTPKLFGLSAEGKANVFAIFGGQGGNEVS